MPPNDQPMVHRVDQAIARFLMSIENLLVGYLNTRMAPHIWRKEDLTTTIANHKLKDQTLHVIPMRSYIGDRGWSWRIWRDGRPVTGRGYYIIGSN